MLLVKLNLYSNYSFHSRSNYIKRLQRVTISHTRNSAELSEFQRGNIVGSFGAGLGQQKNAKNLKIPLATVNSIILQL